VNQRVIQLAHQQIDDAEQIFVAERIENNHFVQPVSKTPDLNARFTSFITISSMLFCPASSAPDWKPIEVRFCK